MDFITSTGPKLFIRKASSARGTYKFSINRLTATNKTSAAPLTSETKVMRLYTILYLKVLMSLRENVYSNIADNSYS